MAVDARPRGSGSGSGIDLEKELSCSICTDVLYQPLTLLDCLHTFCGPCLKEWFSFQRQAAVSSHQHRPHPYTCPQCRAEVRGTRPNATVTTLLEMFLKANPGRGKSEAEKEEMRQHYKPGDDVIPPVPVRRHGEGSDSEDERLMEEIRAMSIADLEPGVEANRRAMRRAERRQAGRYAPEELGRSQQSSRWAAQQARNAEARPRQYDEDGREIEHQPSLRNLLSASELDSQEVQEEIMQSIMTSGVLEGIDIDHLTPAQEEELTERIAEAYRRRQRQRHRSRSRNHERRPTGDASSRPASSGGETAHRPRARGDSSAAAGAQSRPRPPISRPHLFEQSLQDPSQRHRRSASSTSQRSHRSGHHSDGLSPAARSATDLSGTPSSEEPQRERHRRRPSSSNRSITDPEGARAIIHGQRRRATSGAQQRSSMDAPRPTAHPLEAVRRQDGITNNSSPSLATPYPVDDSPPSLRPAVSTAAFAPEPVQSPDHAHPPQTTREPLVHCNRCEKQSIQYDLHYHCSKCSDGDFNLCLSCYRAAQGCNHWFGFGYAAWSRWQRAGLPPGTEGPHVLLARRYLRPDQSAEDSDVSMRLKVGAFCERCLSPSNTSYWHCPVCLEGAWGFCHLCVNKGYHCTHPLLQVAHISTQYPTASPVEVASKHRTVPLPHLPEHSYIVVPIQQDCDICHYPIPPSNTRYHCNICNNGDYDVCNECYYSLVAAGKISQANGPNGWRRCLKNHRMATIGFQDTAGGSQQRVVVREPVGGWALKEDLNAVSSSTSLLPPDGGVGLKCLALWNRFVGDEVPDELSFPKNAEVREVERMNEDWYWGVYAGGKGLFPGNHVRVL